MKFAGCIGFATLARIAAFRSWFLRLQLFPRIDQCRCVFQFKVQLTFPLFSRVSIKSATSCRYNCYIRSRERLTVELVALVAIRHMRCSMASNQKAISHGTSSLINGICRGGFRTVGRGYCLESLHLDETFENRNKHPW